MTRLAFASANRGERGRRRVAFTLVELLVVVGIIAALVGILIPALAAARESGRCAVCLSNLRQIGQAFHMYANDHNDYLVPGDCFGLGDNPPNVFSGAGNWAVILSEANYLPLPEGAVYATSNPTRPGEHPFSGDIGKVLCCPNYAEMSVAASGFPTSQTDPRGANYVMRLSDFSHVAVRNWYASNDAPLQRYKQGRPLPLRCIPDRDPATGALDYRLTKITSFNNLSHLPLIFDGVWSMAFDSTDSAYDPARINARHYNGKSTNVMYADGHCETDATNTLPNDDWYCQ